MRLRAHIRRAVRGIEYLFAVADYDSACRRARLIGLEHHEDHPCRLCDLTAAQAGAERRAHERYIDACREVSR